MFINANDAIFDGNADADYAVNLNAHKADDVIELYPCAVALSLRVEEKSIMAKSLASIFTKILWWSPDLIVVD